MNQPLTGRNNFRFIFAKTPLNTNDPHGRHAPTTGKPYAALERGPQGAACGHGMEHALRCGESISVPAAACNFSTYRIKGMNIYHFLHYNKGWPRRYGPISGSSNPDEPLSSMVKTPHGAKAVITG